MQAKTIKRQYTTVLLQAKKGVPGFALVYGKFIAKTTLEQNSRHLLPLNVHSATLQGSNRKWE